MTMDGDTTDGRSLPLLERVREGDGSALEQLVERHQAWLLGFVRARMGARLRELEASGDVVQEVFRRLLRAGPRLRPRDEDEFRRLVGTIVLNRLRDLHRRLHVRERGQDGSSTQPSIEALARSAESPTRLAARNEEAELVRLALELSDPDDAHVLRLRNWEGLSFEELGRELGIEPDAARMRFTRALRRLGAMMRRIEEGRLHELGAQPDAASTPADPGPAR